MPRFKKFRSHKRKRRPFHSRFSKKRRFIRSNKRFARRLNQVAEKKIGASASAPAAFHSGFAGSLTSSILNAVHPASGALANQMVGSKIFARYATLRVDIANVDNTHWAIGQLCFITAWERMKGDNGTVNVGDMFTGTHYPSTFQFALLKLTFKKVKLQFFKLGGPPDANGFAQGDTHVKHFHKRFKIMKNLSYNNLVSWDVPDIYWGIIYFPAPYTIIGGVAGPQINASVTLSYTDV